MVVGILHEDSSSSGPLCTSRDASSLICVLSPSFYVTLFTPLLADADVVSLRLLHDEGILVYERRDGFHPKGSVPKSFSS